MKLRMLEAFPNYSVSTQIRATVAVCKVSLYKGVH